MTRLPTYAGNKSRFPSEGAEKPMGFDFGLEKRATCYKRKFRWLFSIPGISADDKVNSLPPSSASRPNLGFKEMNAQHVTETIYYPSKPDWKPVTLVLYDLKRQRHPVFEWIKKIYSPEDGLWRASDELKETATLELFDGCGGVLETWIFENAWPNDIQFGDLDMGDSEVVTVTMTLRYDRAYLTEA